MFDTDLCQQSVVYLVNNVNSKIQKLSLRSLYYVRDVHIQKLATRCQELNELDLFDTAITENSVDTICRHLSECLVKLDVSESESQSDNFIEYIKLLELKTMKKLQVLNCYSLHSDEISSLRKQLPHLRINAEILKIAHANQTFKCENGFWDIKAQQIQIFT